MTMKSLISHVRDNRFVQAGARCIVAIGESKAFIAFAGVFDMALVASAQTDATAVATTAQTAFGVVAPITITIAGFYVVLTVAKRVVH